MSKETPATNVVKDSTFKGKGKNKKEQYRVAVSDKNTAPYNDVMRYDEKLKERVLISGISEAEKIAEGTMPPLQYQNVVVMKDGKPVKDELGNIKAVGRFQKDDFERKTLKLLHDSKPMPRSPSAVASKNQPTGTLIVHLANFHRKSEFKDFKTAIPPVKNPVGFKTTYSFKDVKENEIFQVLSTIIRLNHKKENDHVLNYVNKFYFKGEVYHGKARKNS